MRTFSRLLARAGAVTLTSFLLASIADLAPTARADAPDLNTEAILTGTGTTPGTRFGGHTAIEGDVTVVGSRRGDSGGVSTVSVFRFNGAEWVEEQVLTSPDPAPGGFGYSIALSGDVLVVGNRFEEEFGSTSGAAYVYRFDGSQWVQEQKLTASDAVARRYFGWSVAIDGDAIVVGAPAQSGLGDGLGFSYVFRFDGGAWVEEQKIVGSDTVEEDLFGYAVDIDGDVILVSAPGDDDAGTFSGAGYVFRYDGTTWVEEQKIVPSDTVAFSLLSPDVVVRGNTVILSAPLDDELGERAGAAYVYRFDGSSWIQGQKLLASDAVEGDKFGSSVALTESLLIVGANDDDTTGTAYVFRFDGSAWVEERKLTPYGTTEEIDFGSSVAAHSDRVVVGAPDLDGLTGGAFVFAPLRCLDGAANVSGGLPYDLLYINGQNGGDAHAVVASDQSPIAVTLLRPVAGGNGKFVLHADAGAPLGLFQSVLPFDAGTTCFPFLASQGASPVIVANNLGKPGELLESRFYGTASPDPEQATTVMHYPALPAGTVLTLQGLIIDPSAPSTKRVGTTNAITLTVVP